VSPPPVLAFLDESDLARVDALAGLYGTNRDQMIARILSTGLLFLEKQAGQAREREDREGGAS
jgi:hypothetical protein